jgi:hypothetical protein
MWMKLSDGRRLAIEDSVPPEEVERIIAMHEAEDKTTEEVINAKQPKPKRADAPAGFKYGAFGRLVAIE